MSATAFQRMRREQAAKAQSEKAAEKKPETKPAAKKAGGK